MPNFINPITVVFASLIVLVNPLSTSSAETENPAAPAGGIGASVRLHDDTKKYEQCGADVLYFSMRYYDKDVSMEDLAERYITPAIASEGMSVEYLVQLFRENSLTAEIIRARNASAIDMWLDNGYLAVVPADEINHFMLYVRRDGERYYRYNPPYLHAWVQKQSLTGDWSGRAIIIGNSKMPPPNAEEPLWTRSPNVIRSGLIITATCLGIAGLRLLYVRNNGT